MWMAAYLDGKIDVPSESEMRERVAEMVAWNRRRYLNNGATGIYLHYDMVGYTDRLLAELGISSHLSSSSWTNLIAPCFPRDIRPCKEEFRERYGDQETDAVCVG